MAQRHAEPLPPAVFGVFVRGERSLVDPNDSAERGQLLLNPAGRHGFRSGRRAVGRERLLRQRHTQLSVGARITLRPRWRIEKARDGHRRRDSSGVHFFDTVNEPPTNSAPPPFGRSDQVPAAFAASNVAASATSALASRGKS